MLSPLLFVIVIDVFTSEEIEVMFHMIMYEDFMEKLQVK